MLSLAPLRCFTFVLSFISVSKRSEKFFSLRRRSKCSGFSFAISFVGSGECVRLKLDSFDSSRFIRSRSCASFAAMMCGVSAFARKCSDTLWISWAGCIVDTVVIRSQSKSSLLRS